MWVTVGEISRTRTLHRVGPLSGTARPTVLPSTHVIRTHDAICDGYWPDGIPPMAGTFDRQYADHVLLAPPFIITSADIDEIAGRPVASIDAAVQPLHTVAV